MRSRLILFLTRGVIMQRVYEGLTYNGKKLSLKGNDVFEEHPFATKYLTSDGTARYCTRVGTYKKCKLLINKLACGRDMSRFIQEITVDLKEMPANCDTCNYFDGHFTMLWLYANCAFMTKGRDNYRVKMDELTDLFEDYIIELFGMQFVNVADLILKFALMNIDITEYKRLCGKDDMPGRDEYRWSIFAYDNYVKQMSVFTAGDTARLRELTMEDSLTLALFGKAFHDYISDALVGFIPYKFVRTVTFAEEHTILRAELFKAQYAAGMV